MPLSEPTDRMQLHARRYEYDGYQRSDGLWDIEGRMVDRKTYAFENRFRGTIAPGEPLHDMTVRLTVDETLVVRGIEVASDSGPFATCPAIVPNYGKIVGARIATGWRKRLRELFAGTEGCTHITELMDGLATVAFQTIVSARAGMKTGGAPRRSPLIDSCHAFRSDGEVVRAHFPEHYTGDES